MGWLAGKRAIGTRPPGAAHRSRFGHWEGDTVLGDSQGGACILTLVERKSGYTVIGKLTRRSGRYVNASAKQLITRQPRPVRTITVDNGTEFHAYNALEAQVAVRFYFATPHHAWERGTNENTNGLIRQYLPKRGSMEHLTQAARTRIANALNSALNARRSRWTTFLLDPMCHLRPKTRASRASTKSGQVHLSRVVAWTIDAREPALEISWAELFGPPLSARV